MTNEFAFLLGVLFCFLVALAVLIFRCIITGIIECIKFKNFRKTFPRYKIYLKSCFFYGCCNFINGETKHSEVVTEWEYSDRQGFNNFAEVVGTSFLCLQSHFREVKDFPIFYTT